MTKKEERDYVIICHKIEAILPRSIAGKISHLYFPSAFLTDCQKSFFQHLSIPFFLQEKIILLTPFSFSPFLNSSIFH